MAIGHEILYFDPDNRSFAELPAQITDKDYVSNIAGLRVLYNANNELAKAIYSYSMRWRLASLPDVGNIAETSLIK